MILSLTIIAEVNDMNKINIGILGATGAVGEMMLNIIQERNIAVNEVRLFASNKSVGKKIRFKDKTLIVEEADEHSFDGLDIVLGAASNTVAQVYAKYIVKAGALFIDNSSAFRSHPQVPLVIPCINEHHINNSQGIIANPNCATIIALMAIHPIIQLSNVTKMVVSTYQAVSGSGKCGMEELNQQMENYVQKRYSVPHVFNKPICNNVLPLIGELNENGHSSEELKLQNEGRKILDDAQFTVSCTCVRVPTMQCHSEAIYLETKDALSVEEIIKKIKNTKDLIYDENYASPLEYTNQDSVVVSRLRKDSNNDKAILLWCIGDQLRIGAATNAVLILESYLKLKFT